MIGRFEDLRIGNDETTMYNLQCRMYN